MYLERKYMYQHRFVESEGLVRVVSIAPLGRQMSLRFYEGGAVRFEHPCKVVGDNEQIVCAPLLQTGGGHTVTPDGDSITVSPSISCPDCGTHGFVTVGVWRDV